MVPTPKAVTKQYDFLNATPAGDCLFSVRGGIPLTDAFDQLSVLLSQGQAVVEAAATNSDDSPGTNWAASQLLEFSHALVQAMHDGLVEHEKTADSTGGEA